MGKKVLFRLPNSPASPVSVYDRYDVGYRERLRRFIRDDFEQFPEGLPTYHSYVLKIVEDYAGGIVKPELLSSKDLSNFLAGMNSHVPRIQILDAYAKISNPDIAKSFLPNNYIHTLGVAVGDYLESPEFIEGVYDREVTIQRLLGAYAIRDNSASQRTLPNPNPRYLVMRRGSSSGYLLCYEFNWRPRLVPQPSDSEQLKLVTGICIPQPRSNFSLMRDFRYRYRRVGKIMRAPLKQLGKEVDDSYAELEVVFTNSDDGVDWESDLGISHTFLTMTTSPNYKWIKYVGDRIHDDYTVHRIDRFIDSFGMFSDEC